MDHLPYLLEFITHTNAGIQTFKMPNAYDNVRIELFPGFGNLNPTININGKINFFPANNLTVEQPFYINARKNPAIDNRYKNLNAHSLLTGSSLVSSHFVYDADIRLTYYTDLIRRFEIAYFKKEISDSTYSMLRYHTQKAAKLQLSVIGQNLSEFPPFGKPIALQKAKAEAVKNGAKLSPNAFKTRKLTDQVAKVFRGVGTGVVVLSAAQSVHTIIKAENKMDAAAKEAGGWAGSLAGGEIGMQGGAQVGGSIGLVFGGAGFAPGAAIGGFIGGIAGGIGGYIWCNKAMKGLMPSNQGEFQGFGGGSGGGGGATGGW